MEHLEVTYRTKAALANRDTFPDKPKSVNYILKSAVETCVEFCSATSLHGFHLIFQDFKDTPSVKLRYFSKESLTVGLTLVKNFFRRMQKLASFIAWLIIVTGGTIFGMYLIHLVWVRYETTPTITTVETNNFPIWNVPFPAVTICNVNVVSKPRIQNLTRSLIDRGFSAPDIENFFQNLAPVISFRFAEIKRIEVYAELEKMGYNTEMLMEEVAQPCEDLVLDCAWLGEKKPCESLFKRSKTSLGFCCSFNEHYKFPLTDTSKVAKTSRANSSNLIRVSGAGEAVGLRVLMNVEVENYISARKPFYGAEVIIHDAMFYPDLELTGAIAQKDKEYSIVVQPSVIVTENTLRNLNIKQRQCLFSDEKKLNLSEAYSYEACMTECRVDTIVQMCGCIPFFYPFFYNASDGATVRRCSFHDLKCLSDNKRIFLSLEPPANMREYFADNVVGMNCDCLPSCNNKEYEFHSYAMDRFESENLIHYQLTAEKGVKNMTVVNIYFFDTTCIKYRREVFLSWDGLLASFGGIFGLCLGGSIVSLMELLYFMTFKFFAKLKANKLKTRGNNDDKNGEIGSNTTLVRVAQMPFKTFLPSK